VQSGRPGKERTGGQAAFAVSARLWRKSVRASSYRSSTQSTGITRQHDSSAAS
jgi:hypothetical protein